MPAGFRYRGDRPSDAQLQRRRAVTRDRDVHRYKGKPVVMVTADTDMATRMACLDAGSIDF